MNYSSKKKFFFIFAIISVLFIYSALNIKFTDTQDFKFHVFTVKFEYYGMDPVAIEKIITNAVDLAEDCPNDPICDSQDSSCFACVQIPETACELFNRKHSLSRKIFKDECNKYFSLFSEDNQQLNKETQESQ